MTDGFSPLYIFSLSNSYNMDTITSFTTVSVPLHGYIKNKKIFSPIFLKSVFISANSGKKFYVKKVCKKKFFFLVFSDL